MDADDEAPMPIRVITIIFYIIAFVIILITIITLINYILYTVYSIHAIVREQTYADSPFFKQKDIYNYMLLNYIHLLKKKKYNVTYDYYKSYDLVNLKKEDKNLDKENVVVVNDYADVDTITRISNFDKNKPILEKWLRMHVINSDKKYYISGTTGKYIIENYDKTKPSVNIPNNVIEELNILHDQDINLVLIPRGKPKNIVDKTVDKTAGETAGETVDKTVDNTIGVYDMYKKNFNSTKNIYGYFYKIITELNPLSLIISNDDKASYLYIHVNNSFYEMILMLIFVIFFIIFIIILYTFYYQVIISLYSDNQHTDSQSIIYELFGKYKYIPLIILAIVVYCLIHSIIYKYLFITNVYDLLYDMYNEIIKPDIYISSCVNTYRDTIKFDNILDILKEMSHNSNINLRNANQYTVVNYEKIADISIEKQIEEFTNDMLDINKNFTISNFNYNYYTNKLFTKIFSDINDEKVKDDDYKSTILSLLIIYIYFINNNKEDPYIIIKLNKLIFGTVANIGIEEIDKDIEYTLLLRSLVYEKLDIEKMNNYITNIKSGIITFTNITSNTNLTQKIDNKINTFIDIFASTNDNLNFWTPVYFLNLYLAVELGINLLLILSVILIISNFSENSNAIKAYISMIYAFILLAIDELYTALLGVI